ncbi:MAG: hypothetical protein ABW321_05950 [Polyangiales bacterium]
MLGVFGTVICLVVSLVAGFRHVDGTLPYPEHTDERHVVGSALHVLKEPGFDPQLYCYPSLPIYVTAAAIAIGLIKVSGEGPSHIYVKNAGRLVGPVYDNPRVVAVPRKLWAAMGVVAIGATAGAAYVLSGPIAMLLTALALTIAAVPTSMAWTYICVDPMMAMFAALTFWSLFANRRSSRYRHRVFEPALLTGAAMACKYNAFLLLVPCLIAVWTFSRRDRVSRSVELVIIAVLTFLVLCPRFLIDLPQFIDGIAHDNFHYRVRGHGRFDTPAGWPQFRQYAGDVVDNYGIVFSLMALVGSGVLVLRDPAAGAILGSFVLVWVAFLCSYKVHFNRNLLPVLMLVPIYAAIGVQAVWTWLVAWLRRRPWWAVRWRAVAAASVVVAGAIATALPYGRISETYRPTDSRNRFARWAQQNLAAGSEVIIPDALAVAPDTLPSHITSHIVDLTHAEPVQEHAKPGAYVLVPEWRTDVDKERVAAQQAGIAALPAHRVVREFRGRPGLPMRAKRPLSNPRFKLVRIEP